MEKPDVALDARLTRQMSVGMKAYARELAARLPRVAPDLRFAVFNRGENFSAAEQIELPLALARSGARLTHFLSLYAPLMLPRRFVVTIHDLIHLRFPQYFKRRVAPYYSIVVRRLCARAACVVTDDERTVDDLDRFLGVPREKVRVIPLGADDAYFTPASPRIASRRYFLYAGNHRKHKDLPTFLRAWATLPDDLAADAYVTGPDDLGALHQQYRRRNGSIVCLGDLTTSQLASCYAGAIALVHPALCEGFGLPMLEAMLQGCPVIACADAVPSILRPAAITFAPSDATAARDAMELLARNDERRRKMAELVRATAAPLSWDRTACETAQVYREILAD